LNGNCHIPSCNCELVAIRIGNECHPTLICRLTATMGNSVPTVSLLWWQSVGKFAVMTRQTAEMPALEMFAP
jgi:hypothetical protein